jgi:hypothetical protein
LVGASGGASEPTPRLTLLSAQNAKDRLREIVEGFFFRRLKGGDGKHIRRLLVKSPSGLGKTREAIDWAVRYQAEQEGKGPRELLVADQNEAGVGRRPRSSSRVISSPRN